MDSRTPSAAQVSGTIEGRAREVLTPDALGFLADLHRRFDSRRR
jgi:malate synthase